MSLDDRLELTSPADRYLDYCLWEYPPQAAVHVGKFRSVNLMLQALDVTGQLEPGAAMIERLRAGIGRDRTVWGLKYKDGAIGWELYFYDYRRRDREVSITRTVRALAPPAGCPVPVNENLHYFMFSLDVDAPLLAGERPLDEIHMYVGNPGSSVSSGICYSLTPGRTRLENFYFFFDAAKEIDEIRAKVICSACVDMSQIALDEVLWPELTDCGVIVVANKQAHDGVYFSRITVDQLIFFLRRFDYPPKIRAFVEENRDRLDHMLYDVGFDYRMEDGRLRILKSGYYGYF